MNNIFLIITLISWSLPSFFWKQLRNYMDPLQQLLTMHIAYDIVVYSLVAYNFLKKKDLFKNYVSIWKKLDKKYYLITLLLISLGVASRFIYISLLKQYDVSQILPILKGLSNLLLIFFGLCIFKEKLTAKRIIGILLTSIGIYLVI